MTMPTLREIFALICGDKVEALKTGAMFCLLIMCLSLMGWCCIDPERHKPQPTLLPADKADIVRRTPAAMAEATAEYNKRLQEVVK